MEQLPQMLEQAGFRPLGIHIDHALAAGKLPPHHDDPFDRMLLAQAIREKLVLATAEERIGAYAVPTLDAEL
jgi:PIN domain nuclease of toxin-antitoxin system